jgi:hypothetical protein
VESSRYYILGDFLGLVCNELDWLTVVKIIYLVGILIIDGY